MRQLHNSVRLYQQNHSKTMLLILMAIIVLTGVGSCFFGSSFVLGDSGQTRNPFNPEDSRYEDWGPKLVQDDIMPSKEVLNEVRQWEKQVFAGGPIKKNTTIVLSTKSVFPFSFKYKGKRSEDLLPHWKKSIQDLDGNRTLYSWEDPDSKLTVSAEVRRFDSFAGLDWVLHFKNNGTTDAPLLEEVKALDVLIPLPSEQTGITIQTLAGDSCDGTSWIPTSISIPSGTQKQFAPSGGRSSNGQFPFWNLLSTEPVPHDQSNQQRGIFLALGWSGQWSAKVERTEGKTLRWQAGQETLSTQLHSGEEIRTPRILLMPWQGTERNSHVLFRRLLMFEYAPKQVNGLPEKMLVVGQCFDRYYRKRPGWEKFDAQVEFAKRLKQAGCEAYWFDAAWFPVGFPNGVGNWTSDRNNFPNGLEALGREIKKLDLKFVLWFEPERVAPNTQIAKEHPEFIFQEVNKGNNNISRLYRLDDPNARNFLTELLSKRISEFQLDVYRNDFNIDPLPFWKAHDEPNRQGMTEIKYVCGHYQMWDRLRKEHPGLWIDNCASGGRRIDLETTSISIPLWRSDTFCFPNHPHWDQNQMLGLAQYLPLFSGVAWDSDPYTFRSAANMSAILQYNFLDDNYNPEQAQASVREAKTYRKFWYGDFYPLTDTSLDQKQIIAWQLHRSDLQAGLVYLFRREDSPYFGATFPLNAIDLHSEYEVNFKYNYTIDHSLKIKGSELSQYPFILKGKKSCLVVEYRKIK